MAWNPQMAKLFEKGKSFLWKNYLYCMNFLCLSHSVFCWNFECIVELNWKVEDQLQKIKDERSFVDLNFTFSSKINIE